MYISHYLCLHNFIKQSQQPFYTLPLFMDNNNNNNNTSSSTTTTTTTNKKKRSSSSTNNKNVVRLSTDPQSVAARERRHRISERFKILQSLVPGGTKMDTVSMLEEAIHYVKFLKTQISLHQTMINFIDDYGGVGDHPSSSSSTSNHLLFSNTHDHPPQPTLPSLPPSTLPPPPLYFFQGDHQDEQQPMLPNISNNY